MIALLLTDGAEDYEQDLRELLMAFFPGDPFCYEERDDATICVRADRASVSVSRDGAEPQTLPITLGPVRRDNKTIIKRALYQILSEASGQILPWGTLTGIRPVRLAERALQEGRTDRETIAYLRERYLVSAEKAALITEIAHREETALSRIDYQNGLSLYIGIPFCPTTCLYCSFTSYPIASWENRVPEYLEALAREFTAFSKALSDPESPLYGKTLQTVYFGGGTPTSLSADALRTLLSAFRERIDTSALSELTVEAGRPDSITREKLAVLREYGVSRISVNPQTMNQKTLDLIGRRHTVEDVRRAFYEARGLGFTDINMDLIMGLPEETVGDVEHTLAEIEAMRPESLTVHALAVKRAARLTTSGRAFSGLRRATGEEAARMMTLAADCAGRLGLRPYYLYRQKNMAGNQENTGYTLPGRECLYNILMMEELHSVVGIGAGASTKIVKENTDPARYGGNRFRVERTEHPKDVRTYLQKIMPDGVISRDFY